MRSVSALGPPGALPAQLPVSTLMDALFRCHGSSRECLYFGKTAEHRFDSPARSFGVCYAAFDSFYCFAETFRNQVPSRSLLEQRALSRIVAATPLKLVDLRDAEVRRLLGMPDAIATTHNRAGTQAWAQALHDQPEQPEGILYPADHDSTRHSVALFNRAHPRLTTVRISPWLQHPNLTEVLSTYCGLTLADLPH